MKNLRIAGVFMIILVAMLSTSCSNNKSEAVTSFENPELWKILKESDWASWGGEAGCEMKFIGKDKAVVMHWLKNQLSQTWIHTVSDVGTIEFLDENWFLVHYNNKSIAYLFTKSNNTFENSDGNIFEKKQINIFRQQNK